jgi:hypothetical protein
MDVNPADARAIRWAILDRVTADDMLVTGMHLPYPAFGKRRRPSPGFAFGLDVRS